MSLLRHKVGRVALLLETAYKCCSITVQTLSSLSSTSCTVVDDDDHRRITAGAVVTVTVTLKRTGLIVCVPVACQPPSNKLLIVSSLVGALWDLAGPIPGQH